MLSRCVQRVSGKGLRGLAVAARGAVEAASATRGSGAAPIAALAPVRVSWAASAAASGSEGKKESWKGLWALGAAGLAAGLVGGAAGTSEEHDEAERAMLSTARIFSGNANIDLARDICGILGKGMGKIKVGRFADGEVAVTVRENVRGKDVYIIQPTCYPVNDHLVELLLMVSCMRRASAEKITCVIPYYGYARQDRKLQARVPISAADVARLLEAVGIDRVVAVDLHCGQIQGFFAPSVAVDNLTAGSVGVSYFAEKELVNPVIVSPDAGGVYRAKVFREGLNTAAGTNAGLAMIVKQRAKANEIERMDLVGQVDGCDCILVDDMIDSAGTLCEAARQLKANGARKIYCFATHPVFSGPAVERIQASVLEEVVVLNTIPLRPRAKTCPKITQLSVAPLLAEAIRRIHSRESVSDLFKVGKKPTPAAAIIDKEMD